MPTNNSINLTDSGVVSYNGTGTFSGRTITGTTSFVDLANGDGISGNPTISIGSDFERTGMHGWNGSLLETAAVTVTSDGATVTCSVELSGGGNLTAVFSDGYYAWTTAPDTVTLTAGSDTSPTLNYVYLLQSDKTLTASTVGWPATEHAPMCTALCQSAASLQTEGPYKVHVWTDHVTKTSEQGHLADLNFWIRQQNATWSSGVTQTYTITPNGGAADNVILTTAAGVVLQLHDHTFPAFAGTPDVYVVNDSVTPYTIVTDLNALLTDSTGASMAAKFFSLVIWGVVSEDTGDCKLYCNLPGGSYNTAAGVTADSDRFADFNIPSDFVGTGFLISQWNLRNQAAASGTWTSIDEIDLRGFEPSISPGGGTSFPTEFEDNVFRILNVTDPTKEIAFDAASITAATTRTITMLDADIDLANVVQASAALTDFLVVCGSGGVRGTQSIAAIGAAGEVLTSNGAGALPTFQAGGGGDVTAGANITANSVVIGDDGAKGVKLSTMFVSDAGEMTNASQPAFLAYLATTVNNKTGNGTQYTLGADALTEVYDQNSDFNTNGTFTAPVTGRYYLEDSVELSEAGSTTISDNRIITSNRTYTRSAGGSITSGNFGSYLHATIADMDAADTMTFTIALTGIGADTADIFGSSTLFTFVTGALIC